MHDLEFTKEDALKLSRNTRVTMAFAMSLVGKRILDIHQVKVYINKKGDRKRKFSLWALESSKAPKEDFDAHLGELLGFLDDKYPLLKSFTDYQIDVFCMFSSDNGQGGATLPASTMTRLAGYNLDLIFDIYAD